LNQGAVLRRFEGDVAKERSDRREASVASAYAVAPVLLQMMKKGADKGSIQVLEAIG
jgi:hypothetical protein